MKYMNVRVLIITTEVIANAIRNFQTFDFPGSVSTSERIKRAIKRLMTKIIYKRKIAMPHIYKAFYLTLLLYVVPFLG